MEDFKSWSPSPTESRPTRTFSGPLDDRASSTGSLVPLQWDLPPSGRELFNVPELNETLTHDTKTPSTSIDQATTAGTLKAARYLEESSISPSATCAYDLLVASKVLPKQLQCPVWSAYTPDANNNRYANE
ncbi:hypothetical protein J6590_020618 [Homalodisca vitripennis]|nr:hypothetical protein J6590_020618 [Homalodisca vitripennis]